MQAVQEPTQASLGHFDFELFGAGRDGRRRSSSFRIRCDAIGLFNDEILLLSVVGAETSVKALTAGLRASGKDQQRVGYAAEVGSLRRTSLTRCPAGYRIDRTKLDYGLWHVLCLAKRPGFMPVMTETSLWQLLQGDSFTTPLVQEWMPWLYREMKRQGIIVELTQVGCQAGLLLADSATLDALVSEGIRQGQLRIGGQKASRRSLSQLSRQDSIGNLDGYMLAYGRLLGQQAERSLDPLHVPGRDMLPSLDLLRDPFEAQRHVVEAVCKALRRQKAILLVGEMGTGKTLMAMAACHAHANGRLYRGLVFCPGQLVNKWEREIRATIANAEVVQITSWKDLLHLDRARQPAGALWYVIARDRAKLGARWMPAVQRVTHGDDGFLRCPRCGQRLVNDQREPLDLGKPATSGRPGTGLWKRRTRCAWVLTSSPSGAGDLLAEGCGSPLWQMTGELWRYEPALFIKRHLRGFFDYLILDEVHEEKGADTAQGNAAGALAASCRKVIALTGTLIGGYAEHLRPVLFRLAPASLVQEGLSWPDAMAFNERYGRIETRITSKSGSPGGEDNRMSRGSRSTTKSVRPGVMPLLFGRHLIDKAVFLSLAEVADSLPPLEEECVAVRMDAELAQAYQEQVEKPLAEAIRTMMQRQDRRLLGAMLQTLLAYPDYPFGWGPVGYWDRGDGGGPGRYVTVATPPSLGEEVIRPKEQALLDLVQSEKSRGRKVWVYVQYTDKHDVQGRLASLLGKADLQVAILRASVAPVQREAWIAAHAPSLDVVISHPRLVETGLDLFDQAGRYNFPTLCFYETGYNLFTLRQASRRSWRIGQKEACRIVYFHYQGTMQDRALALMGKKLTAAQALEGTFSSEGLVAMAGEDANVEIALARSLVERMDEGDARRHWSKVFSPKGGGSDHVPPADHDRQGQPEPVDLPPAVLPFRKPQQRRTRSVRQAGNDAGFAAPGFLF